MNQLNKRLKIIQLSKKILPDMINKADTISETIELQKHYDELCLEEKAILEMIIYDKI